MQQEKAPLMTKDVYQEAMDLMAENPDMNQTEVAELAGVARSTFSERYRTAKNRGYAPTKGHTAETISEIEHPILPSDKRTDGYIIDHLCDGYSRLHEREKAKRWMEFKVNVDGPIGLCFFGDIHADNPGCDWPTLKRHLELVASEPQTYGVFMGDVLDNWVGGLKRLCEKHTISKKEAKQLMEYIAVRCGVDWLLWIIGNHDEWNEFDDYIERTLKNTCHAEHWRSHFQFKFPCGRIMKIDAAHDHKGHSQWNNLHAQQKAALMEEMAHLFIAGHKHTFAYAKMQHEHTGFIYHLARVKGYKKYDEHAKRLNFGSAQDTGESLFVVCDPSQPEKNWITCFDNVQHGIDFLRHRKAKWESKHVR